MRSCHLTLLSRSHHEVFHQRLPLCPADASLGRWGRSEGAQCLSGREGDKASFLAPPTGACNLEALPKCGETDCKLKSGDYRGEKTGRLFPLSPKKEQEGLSNSAARLFPTFPLNRDKSVASICTDTPSCTATQGSSAKGRFHTA